MKGVLLILSRNFENLKRKLQELINDIDECSTSQQSAPERSTSGQVILPPVFPPELQTTSDIKIFPRAVI